MLLINEPDLLAVANVLRNETGGLDVAGGGLLLTNLIGFIQTVEDLVPLVNDIRAAVSYIILGELGLLRP